MPRRLSSLAQAPRRAVSLVVVVVVVVVGGASFQRFGSPLNLPSGNVPPFHVHNGRPT